MLGQRLLLVGVVLAIVLLGIIPLLAPQVPTGNWTNPMKFGPRMGLVQSTTYYVPLWLKGSTFAGFTLVLVGMVLMVSSYLGNAHRVQQDETDDAVISIVEHTRK